MSPAERLKQPSGKACEGCAAPLENGQLRYLYVWRAVGDLGRLHIKVPVCKWCQTAFYHRYGKTDPALWVRATVLADQRKYLAGHIHQSDRADTRGVGGMEILAAHGEQRKAGAR